MKKQILLALLSITIFSITITAMSLGSDDADTWGTMDNSFFEHAQRPAALFEHDLHNELAELEADCAVCHHLYEDGKLVEGESSEDSFCSDCHGLKKTPDNSVSLRAAYHKRCKDCHINEKKGPVMCGECHIN
jgi:hypothetical protein